MAVADNQTYHQREASKKKKSDSNGDKLTLFGCFVAKHIQETLYLDKVAMIREYNRQGRKVSRLKGFDNTLNTGVNVLSMYTHTPIC